MKSLSEYISEGLLIESFGSDIIRELLPKSFVQDRWAYFKNWQLQWDKVKDSDLVEVDETTARKLQRMQKETHYILWVAEYSPSWRGERKPMIVLITCGGDVISYIGRRERNMSTKAYIDNFSIIKAYDVKNWQGLLRKNLVDIRAQQKDGALALKDPETVRAENMERYEKIIAQHNTPDDAEVAGIIKNAMNTYSQIMKQLGDKLAEAMTSDAPSPSVYKLMEKSRQLNSIINDMLSKAHSYKYWSKNGGFDPRNAKEYADKISETAQQIEKLGVDYLANMI